MIIDVPDQFDFSLDVFLEGYADAWRELHKPGTMISRLTSDPIHLQLIYMTGHYQGTYDWAWRENARRDARK